MATSAGGSVEPATDDARLADEFLAFGDSVSFLDGERKGFIAANISSSFQSCLSVRPSSEPTIDPQLGNFQAAVFQIHAHNKYRSSKRLAEKLDKIKERDPTATLETALVEGGDDIVQAKKAADAEREDNELEQRRRHGDTVVYGQMVQLYHSQLGRYLRVSSSQTSKHESSSMRVFLDENTTKHSWFRIMPRFKVRAEGDTIRMTDQVVLESVKTAGQYISTSPMVLPPHVLCGGEYEVNLSVAQTSYTILPHHHPIRADGSVVKAGDVVQLFHKEIGAYIAAEGTSFEEDERENVHMRIREPDPRRHHRLNPPTSAVSFWQIELDAQPTLGGQVQWETMVRFRHLPTQRYLSLVEDEDGNMVVDLSADMTDPQGVFLLYAVIKEGPMVRIGSYTRIQHAQSRKWLHASRDDEFTRSWSPAVADSTLDTDLHRKVTAIKWDGAPLARLTTSPERMFDDAFIISTVEQASVRGVAVVAGIVPVIQHYIAQRSAGEVEEHLSHDVAAALRELTAYLYLNGEAERTRQKLIRNLGLVELLISVLQVPFSPYNKSSSAIAFKDIHQNRHRNTKALLQAAYGVLQAYLDGDSRKNELYVAIHLAFFQTQVGGYVGVEGMYTDLVQDNARIVNAMGDEEIQGIIALLKNDKNPDYLDFLTTLTSVEGVGIGTNQEKIAKYLLQDNDSMVYLTELDKGRNEVMVNTTGAPDAWQPLRQFCRQASSSNKASANKEYLFLEKQLDLFGELCLGRNDVCIELISKELRYLTWEECFHCVRDEQLPPELRAQYIDLMIYLFIDVGDNADVLEEIQLSFGWNSLSSNPYKDAGQDRTSSLSGAKMAFFPALAGFIVDFLRSRVQVVAQEVRYNALTSAVLKLVHLLVTFGYYVAPADINDVMTPLTAIIDGTSDLPFRAKSDRESQELQRKSMARRKTMGKDSKGKMSDFVETWRLQDRYEKQGNQSVFDVKYHAVKVLDALYNFTMTLRLQHFLCDFRSVADWTGDRKNTRATKGHSSGPLSVNMEGPALTYPQMQSLQGLARCKPQDEETILSHTSTVREYAMELFDRSNYIAPGWRPEKAVRRRPIDHKKPVSENFAEVMMDLARYQNSRLCTKALQLLNRFFSANADLFSYATQALVLLVPESIKLHERLMRDMPVLRRLGAGQIEVEEMDEFNDILEELTRLATLDEDNPHRVNQEIMYNAGLVPVLFDTLDHEDQPKEVLQAVFRCLRAMCDSFGEVQKAMFDRLDLLLTVETESEGWQNDLAKAITEVFTDNQKMCLALKPGQIERMMAMLVSLNVDVPDLLVALRAVVMVDELNVPLKRNQDLIMKSLMQNRTVAIATGFIDGREYTEMDEQRTDLLRYDGNDRRNKQLLRYHINLVDLLASCAEGENRYIESVCQSLLSIDDILAVMLDDDIILESKAAYVRFFLWVYINTGASPVEAGTQSLYTDQRLWQALRRNAEVAMQGRTLDKTAKVFLFEGFLPLLTKLVHSHYLPRRYPESQSVLADVAKMMSSFIQRSLNHIHKHDYIKVLGGALAAISAKETTFVKGRDMVAVREKLTGHEAGLAESQTLRVYRKTYHKQIELNRYLNVYVSNVRNSYNGENVVAVQLPHAASDRFLQGRQYCESEEEDEHLPLGPEFQYFVDMFVRYKSTGRGREILGLRTEDTSSLVRELNASRKYWASLDSGDKVEQEKMDIKVLQLLRAIIHNEDKVERDDNKLALQNEIAEGGALLPIADILSVTNDDVVREALAVLVSLLDGGNAKAQAAFEEHFLGTREETFFDDVQSRMRTSVEAIRELRVLMRVTAEEKGRQSNMMGTLTLAANLGGGVGGGGAGSAPTMDGIELQNLDGSGHSEAEEDTSIELTDEGNIELVLRVLQYMCEGHNSLLQNYLRTQPDNIRSIDLVHGTVDVLAVLVEDISEDNVELIIQTVDTLVEFSQGCGENQSAIFDAQVTDHFNHILRLPDLRCNPEKEAHLKLSCASLIQSMLEDNDDKTSKMAEELEETLDIGYIFHAMRHYYRLATAGEDRLWETDPDTDEEPVAAIDVAYAFFAILIRLDDFTRRGYASNREFNPFLTDSHPEDSVYQSLANQTVSIEIMRYDRLQKIHFLNKWKEDIRADVKEELLWGVDRSSPSEKIRDFVDRSMIIMADIDYFRSVMDASPISNLLVRKTWLWGRLLLLLTVIINCLILGTWVAPPGYDPEPIFSVSWYLPALYVLGSLHIFVSCLVTSSYFLLRPPSFHALLMTMPYGKAVLDNVLPFLKDESDRTKTSPLSIQSLYHIVLLLFSVLGIFYDGYFYCFHLLHVVVGNDILQRVIQSVTKNGKSLLWVAVLMVICIYIYALVAFAFLRKSFMHEDGAFCDTAWECFVTAIKLGLISGGGLGEALPPETFGFGEAAWRTVFDLSYFILITIIALNVVFGIIVDTFSELRDEKYQIQEAMEGECFICSRKNHEFERHGNGFSHHVKHEHCMWDYLAFLIHLTKKEATEYTSHEQFVAEELESQSTTWFPINRALSLESMNASATEDRLDNLQGLLSDLVGRFDREAQAREDEARRRQAEVWRLSQLRGEPTE